MSPTRSAPLVPLPGDDADAYRSLARRWAAAVSVVTVRRDGAPDGFTATAVIAQPLTGIWLASLVGWPLATGWIEAALWLYVLVGMCWLPVVFIQVRLRNLAREAASNGSALPPTFDRLYRVWFILGWPAFAGVLAILWLMTARPDF